MTELHDQLRQLLEDSGDGPLELWVVDPVNLPTLVDQAEDGDARAKIIAAAPGPPTLRIAHPKDDAATRGALWVS